MARAWRSVARWRSICRRGWVVPAGGSVARARASAQDGHARDLADIPGDLPDADALLALMAQDKKVMDGTLRFVLARGIGAAFVTGDVPRDAVRALLTEAGSRRNGPRVP